MNTTFDLIPLSNLCFTAGKSSGSSRSQKTRLLAPKPSEKAERLAAPILQQPPAPPLMFLQPENIIKGTLTSPHEPYMKYTLVKQIGQGSNAIVYQGTYQVSEKTIPCAVKISLAKEKEDRPNENIILGNQQAREEQRLRSLKANRRLPIIKLVEGFNFKQQRVSVYPLLEKNLYQFYKENIGGKVAPQKIQRIAHQIFEGLSYMAPLLIHGDLKPANILVFSDAHIKIADFGLAQRIERPKKYSHVQTPYYRAPEVALKQAYNEKIDMWSAGCILAELHTGTPLFPEENENFDKENQQILDAINHMLEAGKNRLHKALFKNRAIEDLGKKEKQFFDLVQKTLMFNPQERLSAQEALKHPFITQPWPSTFREDYEEQNTPPFVPLFGTSVINQEDEEKQEHGPAPFFRKEQAIQQESAAKTPVTHMAQIPPSSSPPASAKDNDDLVNDAFLESFRQLTT